MRVFDKPHRLSLTHGLHEASFFTTRPRNSTAPAQWTGIRQEKAKPSSRSKPETGLGKFRKKSSVLLRKHQRNDRPSVSNWADSNKSREFFEIKPSQAIGIIKLLEIEEMTPGVRRDYANDIEKEDAESMEAAKQFELKQEIEQEFEARRRRPVINFHDMGIKNGEELKYDQDDVKAVVCDARHVRYDDKEWSLTTLTKHLMQASYAMQTTRFWSYNGKNLLDIYNELYPLVDE